MKENVGILHKEQNILKDQPFVICKYSVGLRQKEHFEKPIAPHSLNKYVHPHATGVAVHPALVRMNERG